MKSKFKKVVTWFLQIIMGLEFLVAGQAKFTNPEIWTNKFAQWGYPDHIYLIVGGLEILGGILIFIPTIAAKAALGLGLIMLVATVTHMVHQEWDRIIVTGILMALLGLVFYLRK